MPSDPIRRTPFQRSATDRRAHSDAVPGCRRGAERRSRPLTWLALFRDADAQRIEEALAGCEVLALPAGTALLRPGEANDAVYLLLSGRLGAVLDSSTPLSSTVEVLPGETVGELSAGDGQPVSALVLALSDARVLRLPRELFWQRLSTLPGIARNLLSVVAVRMRRSNEVMLSSQRRQLDLEYLQQELEVARQLQASMLPHRQPLFPERTDIDVAARIASASAVGGDLYDAFLVDPHTLFFCVGDVSGHGIPAALFMARVVGLVRITAMGVRAPDQLLRQVNDQLCEGNEVNMFVTLLCGFLDTASGRLSYATGGHPPPVLLQQGRARLLPMPRGALVGVFEQVVFEAADIMLAEGDTLLGYTDGLTEAPDIAGEEFGDDRLLAHSARHSGDAGTLIVALRDAVSAHAGGRPLPDDLTLLAVRRPPR
ncbi:PP2C family protein-serine/threonine phosphatase [Methyloversatilis universalis]|uniref:PP2C family protein-serine/threonine phosphatase n=1 Tax=Methyloversatilis universalis TaxID=378211 RepID=UPI0003755010|nr:SpoIIE family protein phosphatase [Methyloversatilis universalis]